jgi:transcriptional regulator with XRE-family HTH domain
MRSKREAKGISLRALAKDIEVTAAYLSDIENGNRPAPKSRLAAICDILDLTREEQSLFYDLAALTCGNQYEDINPYLSQNEVARVALRRARDAGLPDTWWQGVVMQIDAFTGK